MTAPWMRNHRPVDPGGSAKDAFLRRFAWDGGHADVWRVFDDGAAFAEVVAGLAEPWRTKGVTKVCGIESRGFILGGAVAAALGVGFVAIRKQGSLFPGAKREVETAPDYRKMRHVLQIQQRSLRTGDQVLLVDDWIERGSQASAARDLIARCGAALIGIAVMVDQLEEGDRANLPLATSIVTARELPKG
ncbi:MAG: phosphoribosyltransferase family protein [Acidimicrobiia bacterium]